MLKLYIVTYLPEEWCVEVIYCYLLAEEWYVEVIYSYLLAGGVVC